MEKYHDSEDKKVLFSTQIIKDHLYFYVMNDIPLRRPNTKFITLDEHNTYSSFNSDFGPPNIAQIYRLCDYLEKEVNKCSQEGIKIIFYTYSIQPEKRTNALFLIGAFSIITQRLSVKKVYNMHEPLIEDKSILGYVHSSREPSDFKLHIVDCWRALRKSLKLGLINFEIFDLKYYEYYERVENGDWNWIIQDKILAFSGPVDKTSKRKTKSRFYFTPQQYISSFVNMGISTIIRLNEKEYNEKVFIENGFHHYDMFFEDGEAPSLEIVEYFLQVVERAINNDEAVAVHCKQGLGRTGTLICCYLMRAYGMTALEAIAYCRIQRPGSVMGPQQTFLLEIEKILLERYYIDGGVTGRRKRKDHTNYMIIENDKIQRRPVPRNKKRVKADDIEK